MVIKDIVKGEEAHKKVYSGLKKLAETVGSTFGPSGRPVSLQRDDGTLHCTKDGVTVAREITFADQVEFSATTYIKDIANNTVARAGDGTTTSILLAWLMYQRARNENGEALVKVNADFMRGMKAAAEEKIEILKNDAIQAKDPETLEKVALIASNNDVEISELLRDAMKVLGETGNIYVEESKSTKTKMFTSPGMGIMKGFMSNYFVNNPKRLTNELLLPFVLITEDEIHSIFQLNNIFHQMAEYHYGERKIEMEDRDRVKLTDMPHILIICKKMKEDVLEWVITQHAYRGIQACVIQADHLGNDSDSLESWMSDLRLITGCQGIGGKFLRRLGTGTAQCNIADLGRLRKSVVNKEKAILIPLPSCEQKVRDFCEGLKEQIESEKDEDIRTVLRSRLARLSDGVAILSIGGVTEKSVKERADRIEDAVCAVMVAREEGVLPGACSAYARSAFSSTKKTQEENNDFKAGVSLINEALIDLNKYLLKTAGIEKEVKDLFKECQEGEAINPKEWMGYNLRNPDKLVNLWDEGIIEPVKVQVEAIQNSVDIIAMLLNTDSFVIYADDQDKKQIYPPKGGYQALMNGLKPEMAIRM